jgi:hypothetical protein
MTEDDKFRIELHRSDVYYGDPLAADRIEQLVEENKELTLQLLAASGQAADALDKLAKAVEYLRKIATYTHIGTHDQGIVQNAEARIACTALAELEGL